MNLEVKHIFQLKQYLDRIDGIFLDKKGNFVVNEGNSSLNPTKPDQIEDAVLGYYNHWTNS